MRERLTDRIVQAKGAGLRREISEDFEYNKKKLKHVKHILHNISVALGTLTSALNEFSRFKGRDVSPDGLLGGLGYIMPIKEIKESISDSIKVLSDIADTFADELSNPKWEAKDDSDVKELIKEKEKAEDPVVEDTQDIEPGDVSDSEPATEPAPEAEPPAEPKQEDSGKKEADIKVSELIEGMEEPPTPDEAFSKAVKSNLQYHCTKKGASHVR